MSLSTHVKRISPNQWRYYYNQLLFVDAPLSAHFMQGLMLPQGNSPTVEIVPITTADDTTEDAYGSYSEPLSLEAQTFESLTTQLPCNVLDPRVVINIYFNAALDRAPENTPVPVGNWTVGHWAAQTVISASTRSPLSPMVELTPVSQMPTATLIGTFSEPLLPEKPKGEIPKSLCQVSALLAGLMTR